MNQHEKQCVREVYAGHRSMGIYGHFPFIVDRWKVPIDLNC